MLHREVQRLIRRPSGRFFANNRRGRRRTTTVVRMAHSMSHFVSEIFSSADHLEYLGMLEIISFLIAMAMIIGACGAILVLVLIYLL